MTKRPSISGNRRYTIIFSELNDREPTFVEGISGGEALLKKIEEIFNFADNERGVYLEVKVDE